MPDTPEECVVAPCLGSVPNDEACIVEIAVDDIRPTDSVSNVSVKSKRHSTVISKSMSTTS